ncbi:enoyl-CoA hydratase [Nocardia nova]|uniref:Enoyl-CoA hydratase n=1 Tax=Nocardia nova TaxID=37330 RepID=A0A2S6AN25_9NOCA|nr:MaoC/PaaZ C-terminal domain-containing protein [Nocardia nova]PPJ25712.1 enoyl-CoA hydratase [Nocardia nova]PPJ36661.1 enoyl-CoA hydratase [Nocardia nova]
MTIYLDRIGEEWSAGERSWTERDALIYALGVGAGATDPAAELEFTTENSIGIVQKVLPTFAVLHGLQESDLARCGDFPLSSILHAEQHVELYGSLPTSARLDSTSRLVDIQDKGKGALLIVETDLLDQPTHALVARNRSAVFVRGEGGFGRNSSEGQVWSAPDREPDETVYLPTRPDQALLYRLSGDRNPLHSDPASAKSSGFQKPILHGLCTFGFTGRALLHAVCDSDPKLFGSMTGRFVAPVLPGEGLIVRLWRTDEGALFQAWVDDRLVLHRGVLSRSDA